MPVRSARRRVSGLSSGGPSGAAASGLGRLGVGLGSAAAASGGLASHSARNFAASSGVATAMRPDRLSRTSAVSWLTCRSWIACDQLASVARRHLTPSSRVPSKNASACQPASSLIFLPRR